MLAKLRATPALLALIVAGGAILRLVFVNEPMRYDESFTFVHYADGPVSWIVSTYDFPNNHVLHTLAVHFAWRLLGDHVWTVRLPALLAGIAIVPACYLVAVRLYGTAAAIWAAALAAGFTPLVDYSVNARGYTLGTVLMLLALWLAADILAGRRGIPFWAAFVVCSALAVYAVPVLAYGVAVVVAWAAAVALLRRDRRLLVRLLIAAAAAAVLDLLMLWPLFGQPGWTQTKPLPFAWGPMTTLARTVAENWNRATPHPLDWLLIAGVVISLVVHRRIARHPIPVAALVVPVALVSVAVVRGGPFPRTWLWVAPLYLIHAGAGLSYLSERIAVRRPIAVSNAAAILFGVALLLGTLHAGERGNDQPPSTDNNIVSFLRRDLRAHELALLDPDSVAVASLFYFHRAGWQPPTLPLRPPRARPTRALVVVERDGGPSRVRDDAGAAGWHIRGRLRLVRRFEYIEAWRATLH